MGGGNPSCIEKKRLSDNINFIRTKILKKFISGVLELMDRSDNYLEGINPFNRDFYDKSNDFTFIGKGQFGGKASGLAKIRNELISFSDSGYSLKFEINIPRTIVITTQYFDEFMEQNNLYKTALSESSDERIAHHFLNSELPARLSGDIRGLIEKMKLPLAIRSSSLLEDSLNIPLAGVYETKMIPNNHPDQDVRYKKLVEAIKFVYSSTFFINAKTYLKSTSKDITTEKMGIIIQEVVGQKYHNRFYPNISGVAKSYNFYTSGHSEPEDGVVSLALGLGKSIVEGGNAWDYCPVYPDSPPPFNSANDLLKQSQTEFWAVNMGEIKTYDPIKETEYLIKLSINDAEYDNSLSKIASTYNHESDRFDIGVSSRGARLINFAPILQTKLLPVNDLINAILKLCESHFNSDVEIEFAITLGKNDSEKNRFSLLQVRPMATFVNPVDIEKESWNPGTVLTAGDKVLGNGEKENILNIVYVIPETFHLKNTRVIASEIASVNRRLVNNNEKYILIGFGRWGSSDSWLGIPVTWGEISGAEVIIESSLPGVFVDMSQGSHFFHNISNLGIFYFSISEKSQIPIDWDWLDQQSMEWEGKYLRHIKLKSPVKIKVNGRTSEGVIFK